MCGEEHPEKLDYVGDRLRELCEKHKMTKYRLYTITGISQTALKDIMMKKNLPYLSTLVKICDAFGISLAQFFAGDGEQPDLTADEKEILETWKSLNHEERNILMRVVRAFRHDD